MVYAAVGCSRRLADPANGRTWLTSVECLDGPEVQVTPCPRLLVISGSSLGVHISRNRRPRLPIAGCMQPLLRIYADHHTPPTPTGPARVRLALATPSPAAVGGPNAAEAIAEPRPDAGCSLDPGARPAVTLPARPAAAAGGPHDALPPEVELRLRTILQTGIRPGETLNAGYQRLEHELGAQLATLTVLQSRALHRRLANPGPGDALASAFQRLIPPRRGRLLAFLADARRREALALAR